MTPSAIQPEWLQAGNAWDDTLARVTVKSGILQVAAHDVQYELLSCAVQV